MQVVPARESSPWKWLLLLLCAAALLSIVGKAADLFGVDQTPWFGYWDSGNTIAGPYAVGFTPRAGGASATAGIRAGDSTDLRESPLNVRTWLLWQPSPSLKIPVPIHRKGVAFSTIVVPSTVWDGVPLFKIPPGLLNLAALLSFLLCSALLALRRWQVPQARALALVMLGWILSTTTAYIYLPNTSIVIALWLFSRAASLIVTLLLVRLSATFGRRSRWRDLLEWFAYAMCAVRLVPGVLLVVGLVTLRFDPLPYWAGAGWVAISDFALLSVALVAVAAVSSTAASERARAAWLLLPLPIAFLAANAVASTSRSASSWFIFIAIQVVAIIIVLLGGVVVTYALLKRRVLDAGFFISRSIVVAIVSLIVVIAFVLLEWLLSAFLVGASHGASLVANAALALVLGVSLRFIHARVDNFVDAVMFRKRYEDERGLRDFSKEAAFVTDRDALLDQALAKLREHTDALAASLLIRESDAFIAVRSFGSAPETAGENDPAILALKTWHKPLDPHRYATALKGDLVLPMVARGQLIGVLLCGERAGGEAYAPDEVDALSEFARGVGAALDGLSTRNDDGRDAVLEAIRSLPEAIVARLRAQS